MPAGASPVLKVQVACPPLVISQLRRHDRGDKHS